jgi:hypothetical protein
VAHAGQRRIATALDEDAVPAPNDSSAARTMEAISGGSTTRIRRGCNPRADWHSICLSGGLPSLSQAQSADLSYAQKIVLTNAHEEGVFMPVQQVRSVRPFSISAAQLELLRQAARGRRLQADGSGDEAACLALWRAGLLRVNGEAGFELSQLGLVAVRAQQAAAASRTGESPGGVSGEGGSARRPHAGVAQHDPAGP